MKDIKLNQIIGYVILLALLGVSWSVYDSSLMISQDNWLDLIVVSAVIAVIVVTVSIFWFWNHERVERWEYFLGPAGHVLHCGYCLSLWLSAVATGALGIAFDVFSFLPWGLDFFLSWWAVSFLSVLLFELLTVLWFVKLEKEFSIKDYYRHKDIN